MREIEIVKPKTDNYTTVLWVSRHTPLPSQIRFLRNYFGDIKLVQISGVIPTAEHLIPYIERYKPKVVVPVLPLSFIARLCDLAKRYRFTLLWAKMNLLHNDRDEPCEEFDPETDVIVAPNRHFRFECFKIIREVKLVLEDLQ